MIARMSTSSLVRTSIRLDAVVSTICGILTMLFAWPLAEVMGIGAPLALVAVGLFFDVYGAALWFVSRRQEDAERFVRLIVVGNLLWALGTFALAVFGLVALSTAGVWIVAAQAVLVLDIALFQLYAARQR